MNEPSLEQRISQIGASLDSLLASLERQHATLEAVRKELDARRRLDAVCATTGTLASVTSAHDQ